MSLLNSSSISLVEGSLPFKFFIWLAEHAKDGLFAAPPKEFAKQLFSKCHFLQSVKDTREFDNFLNFLP